VNFHKTPHTSYITWIAATPEQIWNALTDGAMSKKYFFGLRIESDWTVGSHWTLWKADGRVDCAGTVLESVPGKRLAMTWRVEWIEEMRNLPETLVTYDLDRIGGSVRLTLGEYHQGEIDEKMLAGGRAGWPAILSGLKTLVETGKELPGIEMDKLMAPPGSVE
jgi:uncharacterized protein YndB with AHSA1/START domain